MLKKIIKPKLTGLEELPEDDRDFDFGAVSNPEYKPKVNDLIIQTRSVKSQSPLNICSWASRTAGKEVDEKKVLSVKSLVKFGKRRGLIKGNGFANLRSPELVVLNDGITEEVLMPDTGHRNWTQYSQDNFTQKQIDNAKEHRSASFWRVYNAVQAVEAMEQGRTVRFGVDWMSSMNNLPYPYIFDFSKGRYVGGHAILGKGFKWNKELIRILNSFSKDWGDDGEAWITFKDFNRFVGKYGAFVDMDIPKDKAKWLSTHNGKIVKSNNSVDVYFIENGYKRLFPDEFVYWAYGFKLADVLVDTEGMLAELPDGDTFVFEHGKDAVRLKEIMRGMEGGRLDQLSKQYFPEFFKKN